MEKHSRRAVEVVDRFAMMRFSNPLDAHAWLKNNITVALMEYAREIKRYEKRKREKVSV